MKLRTYQNELVEQVRKAWRAGYKAPCIVLPCGGGKSCIVAEMARRTTFNGKRVLFLATWICKHYLRKMTVEYFQPVVTDSIFHFIKHFLILCLTFYIAELSCVKMSEIYCREERIIKLAKLQHFC